MIAGQTFGCSLESWLGIPAAATTVTLCCSTKLRVAWARRSAPQVPFLLPRDRLTTAGGSACWATQSSPASVSAVDAEPLQSSTCIADTQIDRLSNSSRFDLMYSWLKSHISKLDPCSAPKPFRTGESLQTGFVEPAYADIPTGHEGQLQHLNAFVRCLCAATSFWHVAAGDGTV